MKTLPPIPFASAGERVRGVQFLTAAMAASMNAFRALSSPATLAAVGRGGPISEPSRLKLKLRVTVEFPASAGGVQHAWIVKTKS